MEPRRTLEELIERTCCVVRLSDALFGDVYERSADDTTFAKGRPILGTIRDWAVVRKYYYTIGARTQKLLASGEDQAVTVIAPDDDPAEGATRSWFATVITQDLGMNACV